MLYCIHKLTFQNVSETCACVTSAEQSAMYLESAKKNIIVAVFYSIKGQGLVVSESSTNEDKLITDGDMLP